MPPIENYRLGKDFAVRIGRVVSTEDPYCANRIKVRLPNDNNKTDAELPFAMAYMPQFFQVHPKQGESVLVLCADPVNPDSERFYAGPIIRQYQDFEYCPHDVSQGLYEQNPTKSAYKPIRELTGTEGAFPVYDDVALIGRKGEDVILRDNTVLIRCGVRAKGTGENPDYQGNVVFNGRNSAYIQIRTSDNGNITTTNSQAGNGDTTAGAVMNFVADKFNLISHKDKSNYNLSDPSKMVTDEEIQRVMNNLHRVPYGDVLCQFLDLTRRLVLNHVHPANGHNLAAKTADDLQQIEEYKSFDLETIKSPNVRVS